MISDQLREVLHARPFQPFTAYLADGRKLTVDHPELMWVTPGGRTAYLAIGRETTERVDVLMITSISTGERNGRGRRRKAG
jgi:hypothetical protein